MPSQRRLRVLVYLVFAGFVTLLFFTSKARHSRDVDRHSLNDFFSKTKNAMDKQHPGEKVMAGHDVDPDGDIDKDDDILAKQMADRLRQAEQKAKDSAEAKGPNKPDVPEKVIGVGSSASGQQKRPPKAVEAGTEEETTEDHEVEAELNSILKKSPVIIFSKSYCPYSKRAKGILLEKYVIEPAPYVVELDLHPLGPKIQAKLGEMTGRKTVPNIMVYGKSIGGGDDIADLDRKKALADKITSLGGSRIDVAERFVESAQKAG
ncbi:thioredoxin-like protein [Chaetomium strumarium]|uniref:Thioredoxin-like protein n=1 Tax=Chaetomium strumarium TaxID=1170767 RepID=A0AAJ0M700_9PEZI|nr:thioredoxin-like protein [Chaetomium strumarium]